MVLAVRRMHQDGKKTQVVLSVRLGYRNRLGAVEQSGRLRRRQAVQLDRTELQLLRHALLSGGRNVLRQPARQGRRMRSQQGRNAGLGIEQESLGRSKRRGRYRRNGLASRRNGKQRIYRSEWPHETPWRVGGVPLIAPCGSVSRAVSSRFPFPLPNGRSENRIAQIGYDISGSATQSVIKLRNRPEDGCYGVSIGLQAFLDGANAGSTFTSTQFTGETCDFDPEKYRDMAACLIRLRDAARQKLKFKPPKPGEPIIVVSDEILWRAQGANKETIDTLLDIMRDTLRSDQQTYLEAMRE